MKPASSLLVASSALAAVCFLAACQDGGSKAKPGAAGGATEKPAPKGTAKIEGTVKFTGTAPPPEPWGGAGNADCKAKHEATIQLVRVTDGKLEDAFVYVKEGLPPGSHEPPATKPTLDQKNCEFSPRVIGVVVGQEIDAGNSDAFMHNVKSPEFNQGFPSAGVKRALTLNEPKVMSPIVCDVHPWMRAYAGVMTHPYFQVTKSDGAFSIEGLVDGNYTVAAWHEKLGEVEVKAVAASAATPGKAELAFAPR